uniref:NADH-ubiquinone oxidoreductase chain 3 n=1 Tax=Lumbricus terrestris TaxID=6398 RepID=NU3M_LUMTE|nr:NADH dehydrogenase subunit 3 [Lumbricus terrestris]Q34950.1 RecName: Full=NADH-ubiquinone oxidoreductase chain 3; AltName: Full=NADH dehydrogenase subunit 3 [Lumbricus terrestris]AAC46875.1 NADH dehydrogenase subunit 3 [Lumbricus terrestris]prf//2122275M NADH dehydrogenase:SUBUNIT=3 [Lumbricus terrestris]
MILTALSSAIALLVPIIILGAAWVLASRSTEDREKSSPFECGFDPKSTARIPFSTRFFLLAIIFIVFDIEIVLLMPLPTILHTSDVFTTVTTSVLFLMILLIGLIHEWKEGSLDWSS